MRIASNSKVAQAMSFLKKLFSKSKDTESYAFRLNRAKELHGKSVKYVTERRNDNDDVVGRGGALAIHEDKFIVDSSGERVFMCPIAELDASYLMSGDGVIIKGHDMLSDGKYREITVHFVYYRK
jgi:hypothetical protein